MFTTFTFVNYDSNKTKTCTPTSIHFHNHHMMFVLSYTVVYHLIYHYFACYNIVPSCVSNTRVDDCNGISSSPPPIPVVSSCKFGLYANVWIDAHHKHDSNQVITSIMNVICNVKQWKGSLPQTLRIQADNTTRENKNIYMFAMCAALIGLGFFKEVHLVF